MNTRPAAWIATLLAVAGAGATDTTEIPDRWMDTLEWRSVGPANMGGRITDIAVYEDDPCIWWAATASGGLLKTVNNGVTFEHQFDREATVSIGAVAVAQSDPKIVWVGTGESNPRNSVSWGDGVYKSTDGGATWTNMGLRASFQIGRLAIHPDDPDTVYVGALGRLWGPNEERGLFRTTDGGTTWEKVLYVDEKTGVIDVQMHPEDPDTLIVATWERERDGFDTNDPAKKWGPGSAIHRTTDGGDTWEKLGEGLPSGTIGRVGLSYFRDDPDVVYAIVESERIGLQPDDAPYMGIQGEDADVGARLTEITEDGPAAATQLAVGDIVIRVEDAIVHSYADLVRQIRRHLAGDTVEVEVSRDRESVILEVTFARRPGTEEDPEEDPEQTERRQRRESPFSAMLGGQRENAQDQQGPDGYEYGGIYRSMDGGDSWERINSLNPRPMYFSQLRVDPSDDDHLFVLGVSLHHSEDGGDTFTTDVGRGVHPDHHAMWIDPNDGRHVILGCDGGIYVTYDRGKSWNHLNHVAIGQFYHATVGPRTNYRIYGGLQDNGSWGGPGRSRSGAGPINEDWIRIGGGDGFVCRVDDEDPDQIYFSSQNGGLGRLNLGSGDRGFLRPAPRGTRYRFNWKTPYALSNHNSRIYYTAGNYVFRSLNRGSSLEPISPEITKTDRGSATALAESPRDAGVMYVGSDDGALWMTADGGHAWTDLFAITTESLAEDARKAAEAAAAAKAKKEADEDPAPDPAPSPAEGARDAGPRRGGGRMLAMLRRADENSDGKIQRSEAPERAMRMFDRADTNKDGALDEKEMEAIAARAGRRRGGEPEAAAESGSGEAPATASTATDEAAPADRASAAPAVADAEEAASDGYDWTPIAELVPDPRWVSSIEASRAEAGRAYVTFDGHRSNDDAPYLFVSESHGKTWRSLRGDLPETIGSVRVLREDRTDPDILYLGTEFTAWVSVDRGAQWTSLNTNLPTVAVHEIAQHPGGGEIVAATHGRSLWVLDVTPLRQMKQSVAAGAPHLFDPGDAHYWRSMPSRGGAAPRFVGQNPPSGASIYYTLPEPAGDVRVVFRDGRGKTVRTLEGQSRAGLHRLNWDLRKAPPRRRDSARGRRGRRGVRVEPGLYTVVLEVDDEEHTAPLRIQGDPEYPDAVLWGEAYEEMLEAMRAVELDE